MNKNEYLQKIISDKRGEKYDIVVMYTGGKDSSYLIYLFKEIYKLRVLAITVDNGYEFTTSYSRMKVYIDNVNVPLEVIKPNKTFFTKMYRELIINPRELKGRGRNQVCHICNNMIWMYVCKYASENKIPFVASGLSFEQLNSGRKYPLNIDAIANRIAEKSTKLINMQAINYLLNTESLNDDESLMQLLQYNTDNNKYSVTTIYPFIYHRVSIDEQKSTIIEYGAWTPPVDISVEKYISSGCNIMNKVLFELEKMELITINEREETKRMVETGLIDKEKAEFAYYNAVNKKVNLLDPIFDEIGIKEYLLEIAQKRHQI